MEKLESEIASLLKGEPETAVDIVDIENEKAASFQPVTKKNTGYIVAAVLFNEAGQVLMMQEAKYSCYGTWYLPAGRVEPNENFTEAAKREVEEETGIQFEPSTIINVEVGSGIWYRFTFTGKVTGGQLKTLENKDKESLQAEWIDWDLIKSKSIKLRAGDVIPLIKVARKYLSLSTERHPCHLPKVRQYAKFIHRIMLVHYSKMSQETHVLVNTENSCHVPTSYISPFDFSVRISVYSVLKHAFGNTSIDMNGCGVLAIEHQGDLKSKEDHDGFCLSTLWVVEKVDTPPVVKSDKYQWTCLTETYPLIASQILERIQDDKCVPLVDIQTK